MNKEETITVSLFQLIAAKHAIKLEKLGIHHSTGRLARKSWALFLGLKQNANHDIVVAEIDKILASIKQ